MDKKDVWRMFEETGKLEYYLKYKEMVKKKVDILGDDRS